VVIIKPSLMKTLAISAIFAALVLMVMPSAFADHETVEVEIAIGSSTPGCEETNECFIPAEVTIDVGSEVVWINDDAGHTVTSGDPADEESVGALFDSSFFTAGSTFSYVFEESGEFPYFCTIHPWMQGMVIVQEAHGTDDDHGDEGYATTSTADGSVMVKIEAGAPAADEEYSFTVKITDVEGNAIEHVNFDIAATQDGTEVLSEAGQHAHTGSADFTTSALSSDSAVDIQVTILGFGLPDADPATWEGPKGETVSLNVVPEFGPIAMIVLAVSIISIVALTARSKVIPRL
jgi:predicted secreted protein with PEFG-CTERM motif